MANPYAAMTPLYHSPGVQSYCAPSDNLSIGHYTDMRSSAGWYGSTANDPRFASEYTNTILILSKGIIDSIENWIDIVQRIGVWQHDNNNHKQHGRWNKRSHSQYSWFNYYNHKFEFRVNKCKCNELSE